MLQFRTLQIVTILQNDFALTSLCFHIASILENEFLVFEEGPSESFTLQWATYQDASDQTSLSRIWGGIHPPIDDIKGRIIGEKIGEDSKKADNVAWIRTFIVLQAVICNIFIRYYINI